MKKSKKKFATSSTLRNIMLMANGLLISFYFLFAMAILHNDLITEYSNWLRVFLVVEIVLLITAFTIFKKAQNYLLLSSLVISVIFFIRFF